jgi:hypothetical protein
MPWPRKMVGTNSSYKQRMSSPAIYPRFSAPR